MNTALATTTRQELTPSTWQMIQAIAPSMYQSRLFGVANESQAAAIMLKGYELGLSLTAAFEFVHIIQGKPSISPRGMLALIYQSGQLESMKIEDDGKKCSVYMKRRNGIEHTAVFSMDDAKAADLIKADGGWAKYPKQMRQWRAIGFCADVVFPDILSVKRSDEYGADLTPQGDVIEGSWSVAPQAPKSPVTVVTRTPQPADLLNDLVQEFGAAKVMEAAGGKIPSTVEEIEAARAVLSTAQQAEIDTITLDTVTELEH